MFYDTASVERGQALKPYGAQVSGIFVLTPPESKSLIARAVVSLPEVRYAFQHGRIVVAKSSTCAYVAEELLGRPVDVYRYASGIIVDGLLGSVQTEEKLPALVLVKGQPVEADLHGNIVLRDFEANDVFIKSANAVDHEGNAACLLSSPTAGTLGIAMGILSVRGCPFIVPVGLEKLIPSVIAASTKCGQLRIKHYRHRPVGYMPIVNAQVVTEIQALRLLTGVRATHIASGGFGNSAGAVVLSIEGMDEQLQAAMDLVEVVKALEKQRTTADNPSPG